jgi:hypothetical protein
VIDPRQESMTPPQALEELRRLSKRVAQLEHMIAVQYLYAAFLIKDSFLDISGWGGSPKSNNLMGVAVQEMQHLHMVNVFRRALREPPCFSHDRFPWSAFDRYPFQLQLEPLSRESAWKYAFIEAKPEERESLLSTAPASLRSLRFQLPRDNLIEQFEHLLKRVASGNLDEFRADLAALWLEKVAEVQRDGEVDHFVFFRDLHREDHPAFESHPNARPAASWTVGDPMYPSHRPARPAGDGALLEPGQQLAQVLYELTCALLDASYRWDIWEHEGRVQPNVEYLPPNPKRSRPFYDLSRDLMRYAFLPLGRALGTRSKPLGVPFLPLPWFPEDRAQAKRSIVAQTSEAEALTRELISEDRGEGFDAGCLQAVHTLP